jgi:hypothetical protein
MMMQTEQQPGMIFGLLVGIGAEGLVVLLILLLRMVG